MHPVTEEAASAGEQARIFVEALNALAAPKIAILPNNDAGSLAVRSAIEQGRRGDWHLFANMPRADYLGFLKEALAIVGNSSSGLLEAPSFGTPAVNIGRRQDMRFRGANVIDAPFDRDEIFTAVERASSLEFRASIAGMENPYGDGHSSERILDLLMSIEADARWMAKKLTY